MAALAPGSLLGGYRVEALIGRGGMSAVYRARQLSLNRLVALKVISEAHAADPNFAERFRREALAAAELEHPHILTVYDAGEADGRLFISMRLIQGEDLARRIAREKRLGPRELVRLVEQIAAALDAAHAAGIVHRDVKPANVLLADLADTTDAYLTDFGIARRLTGATRLTSAGVFVGTPAYVAPEAIRGEECGPAADVYALSCVAYEALSGVSPFERDDPAATLAAHLTVAPPPLSTLVTGIPAELGRVVRRGLRKQASDRFGSAGEFAAAMRAALAGAASAAGKARVRTVGADGETAPSLEGAPPAPTPLVGREAEVDAVAALLVDPAIRLLTLTGPGGMGKSRLAIAVAEKLRDAYEDGALFVPLAAVRSPELVARALADRLGVAEQPGEPVVRTLARTLAGADMLIVLDNFEHLAGAAPDVAELSRRCPTLRLVVTSRAALRVAGERVFDVPPLSLPDRSADADPGTLLARSEAARLFVARMQDVKPGVNLSPATWASVAEICRSLDGMPLALELAAARTAHLSPEDLRKRLGHRLELLGRGRPDMPVRHRSVRAAIDASHELLEPHDQTMLARAAVFVGGFDLEAAEAVFGEDVNVVDGLATLVDNSLLRYTVRDGRGRYTMLEVIREYGLEHLGATEEIGAVRDRHADHYAALAERSGPSLRQGAADVDVVRRVLDENANLRATLRRLDQRADGRRLLRTAIAIGPILLPRFSRDEALHWVERGLALAPDADPVLRAGALTLRAGALISKRGDIASSEARDDLFDAHSLCSSLDAPALEFQILCGLACVDAARGDLEASEGWSLMARALADGMHDQGRRALVLGNLANVAMMRGDWTAARQYAQASGNALDGGTDRQALGAARANLGIALFREGAVDAAWEAARLAFADAVAVADTELRSDLIPLAAALALARGKPKHAAQLLGAGDALREDELGIVYQPVEARLEGETRESLEAAMGAEAFARESQRGRALSLEDLLEAVGKPPDAPTDELSSTLPAMNGPSQHY